MSHLPDHKSTPGHDPAASGDEPEFIVTPLDFLMCGLGFVFVVLLVVAVVGWSASAVLDVFHFLRELIR